VIILCYLQMYKIYIYNVVCVVVKSKYVLVIVSLCFEEQRQLANTEAECYIFGSSKELSENKFYH
jgi:hypothetical protein